MVGVSAINWKNVERKKIRNVAREKELNMKL
jgi:hypothetical protein